MKKKFLKEIDWQQQDILRRAEASIAEMRKLIDAVENCIVKSKGFPIYLEDLQASSRVLGLLASQHTALDRLKYTIQSKK